MKTVPATQTMIENLLRFAARASWHFSYLKYLPLVVLLSIGVNPDNSVETWAAGWIEWLTVPGTLAVTILAAAFLNIALKAELLGCQKPALRILRRLSIMITGWVKSFGYICAITGVFAVIHEIDTGWRLLFFFPFFLVGGYVCHYLLECFLQRTSMPNISA